MWFVWVALTVFCSLTYGQMLHLNLLLLYIPGLTLSLWGRRNLGPNEDILDVLGSLVACRQPWKAGGRLRPCVGFVS